MPGTVATVESHLHSSHRDTGNDIWRQFSVVERDCLGEGERMGNDPIKMQMTSLLVAAK